MNTYYQNTNYGYGPNGFPQQPGVTPGPGIAQGVPVKPWLPAETIKSLTQTTDEFKISATQEEIDRAVCNHRNLQGAPTLIQNEDESWRCSVCGYKFNIANSMGIEEVQSACDLIESILQTMKLMYISMDPALGREFFKIIAFIRKIPNLWVVASNDYRKFQNISGYTQGVPNSIFSIFDTLTQPGAYHQQFTGQPMMGQPPYMGQTFMGGQPQYAQGQPSPFYDYGQAQNQQQYYAPQQPQYAQGQPVYQQPPYAGQPQPQPQQGQFMGQPGQMPQQQPPFQGGYSLNAQGAAAPNPASPNPQPITNEKPVTPVAVKDEFKA